MLELFCVFLGVLLALVFWKVDPLGSPIRQLPGSLGGLGPTFVQQRLPPELPRATGTPQGAHKRTDIFRLFFCRPGVRKVGPLGDWICRLPAPLGGLGQIFVQQRLPPELPRAPGPRQGAHKSPNIFTKIQKKNRKTPEASSRAKT